MLQPLSLSLLGMHTARSTSKHVLGPIVFKSSSFSLRSNSMARSRPISTRPSLPHQNQSLRFPTTSFSTLRHLHTSSPYNNNNTKTNNDESSPNLSPSPPPPTKDPNHPYLFYHTLPTSDGLIALSFLSDNPVLSKTSSSTTPTVVSKTVLGYLPMRPDAALADFSENHEFIPLLHASIKSALEDGVAKTVTFEAELRGSDGFIHIADQRKVSAQGRIPETEDILGSVFVQDGKVIPDTYERNPMHRLVTADGVTILPDGIDEYTLKFLNIILAEENGAHDL